MRANRALRERDRHHVGPELRHIGRTEVRGHEHARTLRRRTGFTSAGEARGTVAQAPHIGGARGKQRILELRDRGGVRARGLEDRCRGGMAAIEHGGRDLLLQARIAGHEHTGLDHFRLGGAALVAQPGGDRVEFYGRGGERAFGLVKLGRPPLRRKRAAGAQVRRHQ